MADIRVTRARDVHGEAIAELEKRIEANRRDIEKVRVRVEKEVRDKLEARLEGRRLAKSIAANQATRRTGNKLADDSAKAGMLAQAQAADNEAREHERRAEEAHRTALSAGNREVVSHYLTKVREHRAHAELARARADSHRRAANAF